MSLSNAKILITGADGFIGSHLTESLVALGAQVNAIVQYNSFNSWGWLDKSPALENGNLQVIAGDIRNADIVRTAAKECDILFHLAALISIPFSYHSPGAYVDTNIKGTLNILQAAKDNDLKRVLITSTSEVYGTAQYVPIDEKHPLQGQSPYSASKIGADKLAESFFRAYNLPVTIVRPFNTYGPRQSARAVIPTIITQLLQGKTEIRLGSLTPTRDFNYVSDTVNGFIEIAQSEKTIGEEINIASQNEITIGDLVELLIRLTNTKAAVVPDRKRIRPENSEVERLLGANEKLRRLTGWRPSVTLEAGLKKTIEWFAGHENRRKYKPDVYSI